jgi:eukaryotic-like serine/threonine-protein kinase
MTPPDDWERIRALFQRALETPVPHRAALLADACDGNETIRREVESLLAAHDAAKGFLENPAYRVEDDVSDAAPALRSGDRIGNFNVLGALGRGGMGEVYRARDANLGREVAIKLLPRAFAADPQRLARFERESRVLASLNHRHIAAIHSVEQVDDVRFLVLELVEGPTLADRLALGPLPSSEALGLTRELASALEAAHARAIVHRDLKPANIKITPESGIKLLDFGLARQSQIENLEGSVLTVECPAGVETFEGAILGTVGYMSPEQASGRPVDFRSDQFALGLVLYEMLAGRRAFVRSTAVETLSAIIREEPVPLSSLCPGIPEGVERVIARCLAKRPEDRFESTRELVVALELLATAPAPALSARPLPLADVRLDLTPLRRLRLPRVLAAVIAVVLIVTLGLIAWSLRWTAPAAIDSVAVLPFENRSQDPDFEYLGDELTESLIDQLSRLPSLTVMGRATVFPYQGTTDAQHVGRTLRVGAVLTGTVSRRAGQLVISAELIETATGARLWGETYDRAFSELLRVQDSIAAEIADRLRLRLSLHEARALGGHGTTDAEAYDLFLKARHLLMNDTEEDDRQAQRLYQQALDRDPNFVDARLGLASTYVRSAGNGYVHPAQAWARADEEIQKVLKLEPGNVGARASLATRRFMRDWDWADAEREFRELSDNPALLVNNRYHPATLFFWIRGRPDEAVSLMDRALRLDPGNLESRIMMGGLLAQAGRIDDAIRYYMAITEIAPSDPRPLFGLAEVYKRRGNIEGAIETLRKAYELSGEEHAARALAGARTEEEYEAAELAVARHRLEDYEALAKERYVSPLDLARLYAQVGQREQAFSYLDAALAEPAPALAFLKVDHAWDGIRDDARFAAVVRRIGIP